MKMVPVLLKKGTVHAEYSPPIAGHPDEQRMYDTMWKIYFWAHMVSEVYRTRSNCATCQSYRERTLHKRQLQLSLASTPLKCFAVAIRSQLLSTKNGNAFIKLMTDQYSKMTRAVPMLTKTATNVANVFLAHWTVPNEKPGDLITDNSTQFWSSFSQQYATSSDWSIMQQPRIIPSIVDSWKGLTKR